MTGPPFHRLSRAVDDYRWWRPLAAVLLAAAMWTILVGGIAAVVLIMENASSVARWGEPLDAAGAHRVLFEVVTEEPLTVIRALGCWALMLPCAWVALRCAGIRPFGRIWSVALRLRRGLLMRCAGLALLAVVVANIAGGILAVTWIMSEPPPQVDPDYLPTGAATPQEPLQRSLSLVVIILLLPVSVAGQEVFFRGMVVQSVGSWLRSPWLGILLSALLSPLSVLVLFGGEGLGVFTPETGWNLVTAMLIGGVGAWLAWRTGGLEATLALHWAGMITQWAGSAHPLSDAGRVGEHALGVFYPIGLILGLGLYIRTVLGLEQVRALREEVGGAGKI